MKRAATAIVCALSAGGCALPRMEDVSVVESSGEKQQGPTYGYRPLDPLDAKLDSNDVEVTNCRILELLPDETMRLAVGQVEASGNVSYGIVKAGAEGRRYVVVLDYMKATTFPIKRPEGSNSSGPEYVPTYVGIGLRLTAQLVVSRGNVDLSNLVAIGAAAQEKRASGTLVIQTLGISGPNIAAGMPIPSEISISSIQNALVALGTIKSKIYDSGTEISPRVVGTYDVFGDNTKAFDAYFAATMANPPKLTQRANSTRCDKEDGRSL